MRTHLILLMMGVVSCVTQLMSAQSFQERLVEAAMERTRHIVVYDGSYYRIPYPGGDVPEGVGVCTDVVIRSYRAIGIDLQVLVHQDMTAHFDAYPSKRIWGLTEPDSNIDHRRVPNLQTFFERNGVSLAVTGETADYLPGDLVTWMLPGNLPHIGIVTGEIDMESKRPLIVHNIGAGPKREDILFKYPVTGHYRYFPRPAPEYTQDSGLGRRHIWTGTRPVPTRAQASCALTVNHRERSWHKMGEHEVRPNIRPFMIVFSPPRRCVVSTFRSFDGASFRSL